jgi:hypothetical protein
MKYEKINVVLQAILLNLGAFSPSTLPKHARNKNFF